MATGNRNCELRIANFGLGFKSAIRNPQSAMAMTLMEILVVLSVIGIIVGMSIPAFSRYASQARLKATTRQVVGLLSLARSFSISQHADHTVKIDTQTGQVTVVNQASGEALEEKVRLPKGVSLEVQVAGKPAESPEVAFRSTGALTGRSVSLILSDQKKQATITVTASTGAITVD